MRGAARVDAPASPGAAALPNAINRAEFARQIAAVERVMDQDRDVLLALAKR
jgi:hypothetical protein